ncbi:hypothetical protein MASR2M74_31860 [Paracoccaceae bacterium]
MPGTFNDLVSINDPCIAIFGLALVFVLCVRWLRKRSHLGRKVRAVTQNLPNEVHDCFPILKHFLHRPSPCQRFP